VLCTSMWYFLGIVQLFFFTAEIAETAEDQIFSAFYDLRHNESESVTAESPKSASTQFLLMPRCAYIVHLRVLYALCGESCPFYS
jgi:hypothetical protein